MILVFILTWIFQSMNDPTATLLWDWFVHHIFLTILLLVLLG
jgi:hypothetical protein